MQIDLNYLKEWIVLLPNLGAFMKVSIGTKTKDGPWGGGNLFAINLKNFGR